MSEVTSMFIPVIFGVQGTVSLFYHILPEPGKAS
jgi:hypothetical protein